MKRAAIYARYSSENQRDESIEDQLKVCRRYAASLGFDVTATFSDRAISGSNSNNRPGYRNLLQDARRGAFDIVIVEAVDRLARKLSDIASVHDELQFHRATLHAVNVGAITTMHVGMLGTMAQIFLGDLREKTKRGQFGRVLQGKSAAGKAFGYDLVEGIERGGRTISKPEAAIIARIFTMFGSGVSPRLIARRLNEEGVPGPEGRLWQDTTIRGQRERGTGLLNNELYIGEMVWNRCSYVKDPRTGKRVARPNPVSQWERMQVPDLRIVSDDLWQAAKRRQEAVTFAMERDEEGRALNRSHRRRYLLSGLLVCGCCGGNFSVVTRDTYSCSGRRAKGVCSNDRTISRGEIESRILTAIKQNLLTPDLVAEFTRAYTLEFNRLVAEAGSQHAEVARKLTAVECKIAGIMRAIEDGSYQPAMKTRLTELEAEKVSLMARQGPAPVVHKVSVHPNLAAVYRRKVEELESLLTDTDYRDEAIETIRSMIENITLTPRANGAGLDALLRGDLARMLVLCVAGSGQTKAPGDVSRGLSLSVVAGTGFEPVTFRL
jgi:site-specific DNA recombinase